MGMVVGVRLKACIPLVCFLGVHKITSIGATCMYAIDGFTAVAERGVSTAEQPFG